MIVHFFLTQGNSFVFMQRFYNTGYQGDVLRQFYRQEAVKIFLEAPVLGQGLGVVNARVGMYSHSMFYELLASVGLGGTLLFVIGVLLNNILFFARNSFNTMLHPSLVVLARLAFIFMVLRLVSGWVDVHIFYIYFYVMLGLVFSLRKIIVDASAQEASAEKGRGSL